MTNLSEEAHIDALHFLEKYDSNAKTYARTFNRMMVRGSLAKIWDASGKEYLDCLANVGALPLGHNHPFVVERITQFIKSAHIQQALDIPTAARVEFMKQLVAALPENFRQNVKIQFCGPSGSDAVEAALKLFKIVTGRRSVITFHGAYHGMTMGSLALMGNLHPKSSVPGLTSETHFFPFPHSHRCPFGIGGETGATISLNYLENVLVDPESGITKPAMIILEAIQGAGGCIPAPAEWLQRLRAITKKHDIPLVMDEVQTGFGRTGQMFAYEIADIEPDAVIMSKALGGGLPLAVIAYHKKYDKWLPGAHAGTFRGTQIAMASGAATIQYIREHDLVSQAEMKGKVFMAALQSLRKFPCIGEIRGRGLMIGIEIISKMPNPADAVSPPLDGALAKEIKKECFNRGLLIETGGRHGAVIRLLPPLIITHEEIQRASDILEESINHILQNANTCLPEKPSLVHGLE